jgi:excisionase family DNA binding protein
VKDWHAYPHDFVPLKALSQRWGEAEQTIRKWIRNGALRGFRFGGLWKVKAADARAFEEKSEFKVGGVGFGDG